MQLRGRCRSNSQLSRNTHDAVGWRGRDEDQGAREGGGRGKAGTQSTGRGGYGGGGEVVNGGGGVGGGGGGERERLGGRLS